MAKNRVTNVGAYLYVRCTQDLWYRVSKAALDKRIDKNELIRQAIEDYLKKLESKSE